MTHETEIEVNGVDVPVEIEFADTNYSWEQPDYEVNHITLLLTEDEYLEESGGDGTSKEYNAILHEIAGGGINQDALEKIVEEYEVETNKII